MRIPETYRDAIHGGGQAPEPRKTMFGGLLDRMDENNHALGCALSRLELCLERIVGPEPVDQNTACKVPEPINLTQQLEQRLASSQYHTARVVALAEKFNRLA